MDIVGPAALCDNGDHPMRSASSRNCSCPARGDHLRRNLGDPAQHHRRTHPGPAQIGVSTMPNPDTSDWESRFTTMTVTADGPVRIVTMNRPDFRNAADAVMHRELGDLGRPRRRPGLPGRRAHRCGQHSAPAGPAAHGGDPGEPGHPGGGVQRGPAHGQFHDRVAAAADRRRQRCRRGPGRQPRSHCATSRSPPTGLSWPTAPRRRAGARRRCRAAVAAGRRGAMRAKEYVFTGDRIPADTALALVWSTGWCPPTN